MHFQYSIWLGEHNPGQQPANKSRHCVPSDPIRPNNEPVRSSYQQFHLWGVHSRRICDNAAGYWTHSDQWLWLSMSHLLSWSHKYMSDMWYYVSLPSTSLWPMHNLVSKQLLSLRVSMSTMWFDMCYLCRRRLNMSDMLQWKLSPRKYLRQIVSP